MLRFLLFLLLISSSAEAAQVGHITGQVHFRERPSRSAPAIRTLPAGAEVYVLKEEPVDWYQIAHAGRVGFVHKAYVRLDQRHGPRVEPEMKRQPTRIRVGMILMAGGVIFVAWVLAPDLLLQAAVLGSAFGLVVVLDQLFQLGLLYSLFSAAFVALAIGISLKIRKTHRSNPSKEIPLKKAA